MKKIRKSTGVALAFLIYVSVTAAYLLPRNTEVSLTEKEQMRERRKKDEQSIHLKK